MLECSRKDLPASGGKGGVSVDAKPAFETSTGFHSANYRGIEYLRGRNCLPTLRSCGIQCCLPGYAYPRCAREGYHLHVVMTGCGRIEVGGESYPVREGQMFLVKHMEETYYQADMDNPWHYVWVTYDGEYALKFMEYAGFTEGVYVRDSVVAPTKFFSVVAEIVERPNLDMASEVYRMSLALRFLSLAIESREKQDESVRKRGSPYVTDYVEYAVKYIHNNYAHIRISDVAKYIGISRTYFSSMFKEKMYMSPQEFLMQVRMDKGKELLLQTAVPINVVAQEVGYEDQLAFSKAFKKKFGLSPDQYRKKHESESEVGA